MTEPIAADAIGQLRRLWAHAAWADGALLATLRERPEAADAWREYAHLLGAEAVWLARLEQRPAPVAIWPTLHESLLAGYAAYLDRLTSASLAATVAYVNSAGQSFRTEAGDILLQVMLHGQYHRGRINLLLRQGGATPFAADYISFVRGVPAATTAPG